MAESDISLIINVRGKEQLREAADEFARNSRVSAKLAKEYDALAAKNLRVVKEARRLKALKKDLRRELELNKQTNGRLGISHFKLTQIMKEEIRVSKERVLTDKKFIAAAQNKARAQARERAEIERLRKAYAPAIVAQEQYERTLKEIEFAFKTGIIEVEEYRQAIARTKREFAQFTAGTATGGNQFAKFNVEAYKTAQTFKRQFNTGMQQAGFQVGDFFVQIQSGQSALVALGQQGSQLAGIFGPGGAMLGAFLAIGTAIATIVIKAREAEKALSEMSVSFTEASNKATSSIKQLNIDNFMLEKGIENATLAMIELGLETTKEQQALNDLKNQTNLLGRTGIFEFGGGFSIMGLQLFKTDEQKLEFLEKQKKVMIEQLAENKKLTREKEAQNRLNQIMTDAMTLEAEVMEELRIEEQKRSKLIVSTRRFVIDIITKAEREAAEKRARLESFLTEQSNKGRRDAIAAIYAAEREALIKNDDLQEFIHTGRNTARLHMLREITKAEEAEAIKQDKLQQQLDDKRHSQENKRFEIFSKLRRDAIASIYEAERAEIERTANLERFILVSRNQARVQMLRTISEAETKFADDQAKAAAKLAEANNRDTEGFITDLSNEYKKMLLLRNVSEDQLDLQSALIDAKQEYGSKATKVQMDVIEATLRLIDVERQHQQVVEEAKRKQEELSEILGSSLENAMMSIVDGTSSVKDAFKEMAAAIIKDLYRVLVVQQLVASFKTATGPFTSFLSGFSADGNAFSRGNRITAYANGGVVGGPTYFPMSGNRVGLMGEAGPEAIMPLSRGKDGKLGVQASGQGVTVNQNINISTGVQQTVRTEIKSLMPQIAEASKAAVADAKRRGGSYGRTFS